MLWLSVPSSCLHWVVLFETFSTKMLMKSKMSEAGKYTCLLSFNFFFLFHEASLHYTSLLSKMKWWEIVTYNWLSNIFLNELKFPPHIRMMYKDDSQEALSVCKSYWNHTLPKLKCDKWWHFPEGVLVICHTIKWQIIFFRHTF